MSIGAAEFIIDVEMLRLFESEVNTSLELIVEEEVEEGERKFELVWELSLLLSWCCCCCCCARLDDKVIDGVTEEVEDFETDDDDDELMEGFKCWEVVEIFALFMFEELTVVVGVAVVSFLFPLPRLWWLWWFTAVVLVVDIGLMIVLVALLIWFKSPEAKILFEVIVKGEGLLSEAGSEGEIRSISGGVEGEVKSLKWEDCGELENGNWILREYRYKGQKEKALRKKRKKE